MTKLVTGFAAASALFAFVSAAQAECFGNHKVTASAESSQETVAVSRDDGAVPPSVTVEESQVAQASLCVDGEKECAEETNSAAKR